MLRDEVIGTIEYGVRQVEERYGEKLTPEELGEIVSIIYDDFAIDDDLLNLLERTADLYEEIGKQAKNWPRKKILRFLQLTDFTDFAIGVASPYTHAELLDLDIDEIDESDTEELRQRVIKLCENYGDSWRLLAYYHESFEYSIKEKIIERAQSLAEQILEERDE